MNRACFVLRRLFCLLGLAVGLCLVLAGCAENEPVSQAQAPFLLNYYNPLLHFPSASLPFLCSSARYLIKSILL